MNLYIIIMYKCIRRISGENKDFFRKKSIELTADPFNGSEPGAVVGVQHLCG